MLPCKPASSNIFSIDFLHAEWDVLTQQEATKLQVTISVAAWRYWIQNNDTDKRDNLQWDIFYRHEQL